MHFLTLPESKLVLLAQILRVVALQIMHNKFFRSDKFIQDGIWGCDSCEATRTTAIPSC